MKIALAQINPTVGDIIANTAAIRQFIDQAARDGAQLVIFPELALSGYPPKDLLLKPQFIDDCQSALADLAQCCTDCAALVGLPCRHQGQTGRDLHNAVAPGENRQHLHRIAEPSYSPAPSRPDVRPPPSESRICVSAWMLFIL